MHCPSYLSTKKNTHCHITFLEKEQTTILPPSLSIKALEKDPTAILPLSSSIKADIANNLVIEVGKHENKNDAFKAFKSNNGVKEAMIVLDGRGDADIEVQLNSVDHRIYVCLSSDCNCIMVNKSNRDHFSDYCRVCQQKNWKTHCSAKNVEDNYATMVSTNSNTKFNALSPDMQAKQRLASRSERFRPQKSH